MEIVDETPLRSTPQEQDFVTTPNSSRPKAVYTVIEQEGRERGLWVRVGVAWVNRDGSLNIRLNALPVNGQLHVRDESEREWSGRRDPRYRTQKGN